MGDLLLVCHNMLGSLFPTWPIFPRAERSLESLSSVDATGPGSATSTSPSDDFFDMRRHANEGLSISQLHMAANSILSVLLFNLQFVSLWRIFIFGMRIYISRDLSAKRFSGQILIPKCQGNLKCSSP